MSTLNRYKQTKEWERAYFDTRRDLGSRTKRLNMLNIQLWENVLDLGCGDGLNITILKASGVKNIIGVEPSKQFVKLAKKNNPGVDIVQGTAEKLPFKTNSFDTVFVDSVFHHIVDYHTSLAEIKRVLKNGGFFCFIEPRNTPIRWIADIVAETWFGQNIPFLKDRSRAYMGERDVMRHWLSTYGDFYAILDELNFKKVFVKNIGQSFVGKYKNEKSRRIK